MSLALQHGARTKKKKNTERNMIERGERKEMKEIIETNDSPSQQSQILWVIVSYNMRVAQYSKNYTMKRWYSTLLYAPWEAPRM